LEAFGGKAFGISLEKKPAFIFMQGEKSVQKGHRNKGQNDNKRREIYECDKAFFHITTATGR
jgi:hypothetical protein